MMRAPSRRAALASALLGCASLLVAPPAVASDLVVPEAHAPSLAASGGSLAFVSASAGLVPHDTNGADDVFVVSLGTGRVTRVSVGPRGRQANGPSSEPSVSAGGRYVAFTSMASNLVAGDTNGVADVFVRDLVLGRTTRASVAGRGGQASSASDSPSISGNGRFVAFESSARLAPSDTDDTYRDVFVRDLAGRRTTEVSPPSPVPGWDPEQVRTTGGLDPWISGDGRYVGFQAPIVSEQTQWTIAVRRDRWTMALAVSCGDGDDSGFCIDPVVLAGSGQAEASVKIDAGGRLGIVTYFDGRPEWVFWPDTVDVALSGDGDTVAFTTGSGIGGDVAPLYVLERTGSSVPELIADGARDPSLSADGCRVAYVVGGAVRVTDRCP